MELLVLLALLMVLDLAAWRWGHDSRDWRSSAQRQLAGAQAEGTLPDPRARAPLRSHDHTQI